MKRTVSLVTACLMVVSLLAPASAMAISDNANWCSSVKATSLSIQLPAGYWSQGQHAVSFHAEIPAEYAFDGQAFVEDGTIEFQVDPTAPLYPGNAFLFWDVNGTGDPILVYGGQFVHVINPAQPTILYGQFGWEYRHWYTKDQMVREYEGLSFLFQWDQNGSGWKTPYKTPLVSGCVGGQFPPFTGWFLRTWGNS